MTLRKAQDQTCAIVTDACCDLAPSALEQLGVACCEASPRVVDLAGFFRDLFKQGFEAVVSIHASDAVPAARAAAAAAGDAGRVHVVDTHLTSAALALVVERASAAAAAGSSADEVASVASDVAAETVLYVISDPRAPRQGEGGIKDRLAFLRRRALGMRHLVRVTTEEHKVMAESEDLAQLTGRLSQLLSACSHKKGALCYIEAAGSSSESLVRLKKPLDTNEYVSFPLTTIIPAPTLARNAGQDCVGIAVVPEPVYGDHTSSLFDKSQPE